MCSRSKTSQHKVRHENLHATDLPLSQGSFLHKVRQHGEHGLMGGLHNQMHPGRNLPAIKGSSETLSPIHCPLINILSSIFSTCMFASTFQGTAVYPGSIAFLPSKSRLWLAFVSNLGPEVFPLSLCPLSTSSPISAPQRQSALPMQRSATIPSFMRALGGGGNVAWRQTRVWHAES